jgi:lipoate-protein ligase A
MTERWRLLVDGPCEPSWNMAVDEALLRTAPGRDAIPTLRLYWWHPAALSLGANQESEFAVDWDALAVDGYGVVRRPTGGRAILHAEELTYSVTAPAPQGGTLASYRWIARGRRAGLEQAGIMVELERMSRPQATALATRQPCFTAAGRYELVHEGRKVAGSAQRRRGGWLMQHGSILLGPEHLRLPRYLRGADAGAEVAALKKNTVDCSTLMGRPVLPEEMIEPFVDGFARGLDVELEPGSLDVVEYDRARSLERDCYTTREWTVYGRRPATTPERIAT